MMQAEERLRALAGRARLEQAPHVDVRAGVLNQLRAEPAARFDDAGALLYWAAAAAVTAVIMATAAAVVLETLNDPLTGLVLWVAGMQP
jgi:hypothetical protein